jgi:hypothetical protein
VVSSDDFSWFRKWVRSIDLTKHTHCSSKLPSQRVEWTRAKSFLCLFPQIKIHLVELHKVQDNETWR